MKNILLLLTFFFVKQGYSTEVYSIPLSKNEKLESTFSIATNKTESAHFLFIKNTETDQYEIHPYFFASDKTVKALDRFSTAEMTEIVAQHVNGSIITLVSYEEKNKKLFVIDFDVLTGKNNFSTKPNYTKPKINFSQTNQSVIVKTADSGREISVETILNSSTIKTATFKPNEEFFKFFKYASKNEPQAINQSEYVENGSIHTDRVYLSGDKVYFSHFKDKASTQVFTFNLSDNSAIFSDFNFNFDKDSRDQNSFIFDDYLLAVSSSKEDVVLNKYNLNTTQISSSLSLSKNLASILDQNTIQKFLSEAKKANLKTTAVVNKTKSNKTKIRLGIVNQNTYYYNYNWWFHHHFMMQQMRMQQAQMRQMQQSVPRGFGPNSNSDDQIYLLEKEEKYPSIEFVVDLDFKPQTNSNEETEFKYFDKDAVLNQFEEDKTIKKFSSSFLDNELRYVYQDSKTKKVTINFKPLN